VSGKALSAYHYGGLGNQLADRLENRALEVGIGDHQFDPKTIPTATLSMQVLSGLVIQ
jgi:hypothetical protein